VYVGTSILAAAIFEEPTSTAARGWFRRTSEHIVVSDLAGLELAAVVSRALRTSRFGDDPAAERFQVSTNSAPLRFLCITVAAILNLLSALSGVS
jgi:predicted nucleic acid-binding protein